MDDFVILTDSCCDMTARMAADLELEVLPLSLNMEDRVYHNYLDGREIGFQDFYARLRAGALATTSAISVGVFDEAMRKILDSGRDVLYLAFSSALSTTYQSAVIAADIAVKSGDVYLGFADRFTGTVIITGELADVTSALTEIVNYFRDELGYVVCRIPKRQEARRWGSV